MPTGKDWADLCAVTAIASSVDRNTALYTKIGPLRLNIFSINIGPSRFSYKTVALMYCLIPTLYNLGENLNKRFLLPSRYSMEGLIEYMTEFSSQGCIVRDEFTSQFKDVRNKKYLAEGMEFLSELYDGMLQVRYTKSSKLEEVTKVYISYIGATTPYVYTIPYFGEFFWQGIGNRFLYVNTAPNEEKILDFEDDLYSTLYDNSITADREIETFARRLGVIRENAPKWIGLDFEAQKKMIDFGKKCSRRGLCLYEKDRTDPKYSYYGECRSFALKLAALHCLSRNEPMYEDFNENQLMVIEKDVEWAINKVNVHIKHFEDIMADWKEVIPSSQPTSQKAQWDRVESILRRNNGKMKRSDLQAELKIGDANMTDLINGLLGAELIDHNQESTGKRGMKPYYVRWLKK